MPRISGRCWLLPLAYVFLDAKLVTGQGQAGRLDVLKGVNKETSCTLRNIIHSTCSGTTPPPAIDVTPVPSPCTCNTVYFNVWSACSYSSGNNTLPVFSNWTSTCSSSGVDLTDSENTASLSDGLGIDIPAWAKVEVPNGNSFFDIQHAVLVAEPPTTRWSILQILAPLITAFVAVLITFSFLLYCRPRIGKSDWRGSVRGLFHRVHKVKPVSQPSLDRLGWAIDQEVLQRPPMVDPISPVETTHRFTSFTIQGNPSAPPTILDFVDEPVRPPGGKVYPFAPIYAPNNTPASNSHTTSGRTSNTSSLLSRFRLPKWKPRPQPVKVVQPSARFKVDHREQSVKAISSAGTSESFGPRGSYDIHEHEDHDDEFIQEFDSHADEHDSIQEERMSLIPESDEQRMSLNTGTSHSHIPDSSINSHVGIIPPSNSSSSPRDSRPGSFPAFFFPRNPPPVPPPPTQPAPAPPSGSNRAFRREGPLNQLPMERLMATIQEHNERRTPSPMPSLSSAHIPRPSIDNPRPLPNTHQRSNSQNGSASSVYEESSGLSGNGVSRMTPSRSGSGDSQNSLTRAFSRPLPTPSANPNNSIPLHTRNISQGGHIPAHQHTASGSSSSGQPNLYQDPFAVPPAAPFRGRSLDWDDDGGSFYLESVEPPPRPVRSPSPLAEELGDPALLFHPSVRGAGYRGTPN